METTTHHYIPGVCNIGPAEIAKRRQAGWLGLAAAALLLSLLVWLDAPVAARLLVFFPATLAASGFLQAHLRFCAGFGLKGVFNLNSEVGKTDTVMRAEFRAQDRRKALQIFGSSAAIGLAVAIASILL